MQQVINLTSNLHGGCFHFLTAVYNHFYGSHLQLIQIMLGWKRIKGYDVSQCYQQAAGLTMLVADEIEKILC